MEKDPFKEYVIEKEPAKRDLVYSWYTAIGLQKVDGLETSEYLKSVAKENIDGNITIETAKELIKSYYKESGRRYSVTEEADIVSVNIAEVLSDKGFVFSPAQYLDIHKEIFHNVFPNAGKLRTYNISKNEWVLNGDTVIYGGVSSLKATLEYDFEVEKNFDYSLLNKDEFIKHIARFIANVWQIHVFSEGNTRTTAVFLIKYLRTFGFDVTNDIFAENAWYFRNALVRANYTNTKKGIYETTEYLEKFLNNLIYGETNDLKNRFLNIDFTEKVDIETEKVDIDAEKVDIDKLILTAPLKRNTITLYRNLSNKIFGRSDIIEILHLSPSGSSRLISSLLSLNIIVPIKGRGKGKYVFNIEDCKDE